MARCRGVQPGGVEALRCLQTNAPQLSPACRSAVAALGGAPRGPAGPTAADVGATAPPSMPSPAQQSAIRFSCRSDFMTLCRGVPQGGPEAYACLQNNAPRASQECRTALMAAAEDDPTTAANTRSGQPLPPGPFPIRRAIREKLLGGQ